MRHVGAESTSSGLTASRVREFTSLKVSPGEDLTIPPELVTTLPSHVPDSEARAEWECPGPRGDPEWGGSPSPAGILGRQKLVGRRLGFPGSGLPARRGSL